MESVPYAQENHLEPHLERHRWVIAPRKNAAFVRRIGEVSELYEEPYDPLRSVVCFDERPSCRLIGDAR